MISKFKLLSQWKSWATYCLVKVVFGFHFSIFIPFPQVPLSSTNQSRLHTTQNTGYKILKLKTQYCREHSRMLFDVHCEIYRDFVFFVLHPGRRRLHPGRWRVDTQNHVCSKVISTKRLNRSMLSISCLIFTYQVKIISQKRLQIILREIEDLQDDLFEVANEWVSCTFMIVDVSNTLVNWQRAVWTLR